MEDIRPSAQVVVTTPMDEIEDVKIFETHEAPTEDIPLPVAPLDKPVTEMASTETPAPEALPAVEAAVIEHVATAEPVPFETPQGEAAELDVNIATSASACKNHNVFEFSMCFSHHLPQFPWPTDCSRLRQSFPYGSECVGRPIQVRQKFP